MLHHGPGEEPCTGKYPFPALVIDRHLRNAAARGPVFENKTADALTCQFLDAPAGPPQQFAREVLSGLDGDKAGGQRITGQAAWLARHAEPTLYLRADRDKPHKAGELIGKQGISLVPAIPADWFSEETGANAQGDGRVR